VGISRPDVAAATAIPTGASARRRVPSTGLSGAVTLTGRRPRRQGHVTKQVGGNVPAAVEALHYQYRYWPVLHIIFPSPADEIRG